MCAVSAGRRNRLPASPHIALFIEVAREDEAEDCEMTEGSAVLRSVACGFFHTTVAGRIAEGVSTPCPCRPRQRQPISSERDCCETPRDWPGMEVALRRDREPDMYRRALTTAVAQTGRLRQIVESFLFLARADADAELPGLETIDLTAWVRDYLDGHPHDRKDDVRFAAPPTNIFINAQSAMLDQVVGNLIDNACKYSDPGTAITVSIGVEGGEVTLAVEDAGHGIESAEVGRIFEPFFRSAEARRRGATGLGLGLGLAVAARIVRSFGGRFDVWSEPGRGSRFMVRLPHPAEKCSGPPCPQA
ncbi:MAG: hypothetical protein C0467_31065 [Planctomycetaceae bacterium]|nr:hypothetical protein [Planctomycetaceae bacterium]